MDLTFGSLFFAGVGAAGGYVLKYILDKRGEAESRRFKDKRDHYRNLILATKSLAEGQKENVSLFWFEYSFLWLYAPDIVLKAAHTVGVSLNKSPLSTAELGSGPIKLLA